MSEILGSDHDCLYRVGGSLSVCRPNYRLHSTQPSPWKGECFFSSSSSSSSFLFHPFMRE